VIAYIYVWSEKHQCWCFNDIASNEDQAKEKGRLLWKSGVAGVRIDITKTVVDQRRK